MNFYIAQAVGILVAVASIVSVQFNSIQKILASQILINSLASLNYALLGGFSGAGVNIFAIFQTIWIYFYNKKSKKFPLWAGILCIGIYIIISLASFNGFPTVLSCLAAIFYAVAVLQNNPKFYRVFLLMNNTVWIGYDIYTHAYTTIFTHAFVVASIVTAIIRNDINKKKEKEL